MRAVRNYGRAQTAHNRTRGPHNRSLVTHHLVGDGHAFSLAQSQRVIKLSCSNQQVGRLVVPARGDHMRRAMLRLKGTVVVHL